MLYNDEYTFKVEYKEDLKYIRTPRNSNEGKCDFTALDLYLRVKNEFYLNTNNFKLTLNEKKIPCNKLFSVFSLPYLPYQRIKVDLKTDYDDFTTSELKELTIKYNLKDLFLNAKSEEKYVTYKPTDFGNNHELTVLDIKKKFAHDISKNNESITPYELVFTTKKRFVSDDEYPFHIYQIPLIAARRPNNDAIYPLFFTSTNDKAKVPIKKLYSKNTTFGQIAFDLFGENYYKYQFELIRDKYPKINKRFTLTTIVDEIKIENEEFQLLNYFKIKEINECYYNFSFYNQISGEKRNDHDFPYDYRGRIAEVENSHIYSIQQKIASNIKTFIECEDIYFLGKYNLKAKIGEYGSPSEFKFYCKQYPYHFFNVFFYNEREFGEIVMKDYYTVFNLRKYISTIKEVNIENVLIFCMNLQKFAQQIKGKNKLKGLDDDVIIKRKDGFYIVYIIPDTNDVYINPKILDEGSIEKEQADPNSKPPQNNEIQKSGISIYPNQPEQNQFNYFGHNKIDETDAQDNFHSSENIDQRELLEQNLLRNADLPDKTKNNEPTKVAPKHKVKPQITHNDTQPKKQQKSSDESNKPKKQQTSSDGPNKPKKETEEKRKPIKEIQKEPEYIELKFKCNRKNQELLILHPPNDETLSTLESKIRRFYKIDTKIEFFFENDYLRKKPINNLKFSQIKDSLQPIIIYSTDDILEKKIYYQIYGDDDINEIDNIKTIEELKLKLCRVNRNLVLNQISVIFGGKVLNDEILIKRLASTEDDKIILTIYQDKSIEDFSSTVNLGKILKKSQFH